MAKAIVWLGKSEGGRRGAAAQASFSQQLLTRILFIARAAPKKAAPAAAAPKKAAPKKISKKAGKKAGAKKTTKKVAKKATKKVAKKAHWEINLQIYIFDIKDWFITNLKKTYSPCLSYL